MTDELELSKEEQCRLEQKAMEIVRNLEIQEIPKDIIELVIRTLLEDAMVKFTYEFCIKLESECE